MSLCDQCPFRRQPPMAFGDLVLADNHVTWRGTPIHLTHGEFRVVMSLASHPGYRTFREVYDCVQSPGFMAGRGDTGFRANVRSTIKRLRRKFQAVDPTFNHIKSLAGVGYCWEVVTQ